MGYETRNDCVGCPQGCINCGRREDYTVYYCDRCEDDIEENFGYDFDGDLLCRECAIEHVLENIDDLVLDFYRKAPEEEFYELNGDYFDREEATQYVEDNIDEFVLNDYKEYLDISSLE